MNIKILDENLPENFLNDLCFNRTKSFFVDNKFYVFVNRSYNETIKLLLKNLIFSGFYPPLNITFHYKTATVFIFKIQEYSKRLKDVPKINGSNYKIYKDNFIRQKNNYVLKTADTDENVFCDINGNIFYKFITKFCVSPEISHLPSFQSFLARFGNLKKDESVENLWEMDFFKIGQLNYLPNVFLCQYFPRYDKVHATFLDGTLEKILILAGVKIEGKGCHKDFVVTVFGRLIDLKNSNLFFSGYVLLKTIHDNRNNLYYSMFTRAKDPLFQY
ncbi:hypothetical protein MHBO_000341 [Bonamia ostreae]|uniref:Uncharacterized protein n=1 Tax=Bonamia ostreae TaxID=126728 RepID=A0ABV2AFY0_9EUKA